MDIHFQAGLLLAIRDPRRVKTVDPVSGEIIERGVYLVAELPDHCGFAHLARSHDDLDSPPRLFHPRFQDTEVFSLEHDFVK